MNKERFFLNNVELKLSILRKLKMDKLPSALEMYEISTSNEDTLHTYCFDRVIKLIGDSANIGSYQCILLAADFNDCCYSKIYNELVKKGYNIKCKTDYSSDKYLGFTISWEWPKGREYALDGDKFKSCE